MCPSDFNSAHLKRAGGLMHVFRQKYPARPSSEVREGFPPAPPGTERLITSVCEVSYAEDGLTHFPHRHAPSISVGLRS